jgi:hypothetical protein
VAAKVLTGLGTGLTQVRRQVIAQLREPSDEGPLLGQSSADLPAESSDQPPSGEAASDPAQGPPAGPGAGGPWPDIMNALVSIADRLTVIEQRLGIAGPAAPAVNYDEQIEMVRLAKVAAIKAQDFEKAAILRDQEKELTAQKEAAAKEPKPPGDVVSSVEETARLRGQMARMQALLRRHGIDPDGPAASAE